jgi:hypothetical protein
MNLVKLSSWEWIVILCILMLLVWLLIVFQARQSKHEVQLTQIEDHGAEDTAHSNDHLESHEGDQG